MSLSGQDFGTTDPKKIAQQNRQWGLATGQGLMDEAGAQATGYGQQAGATNAQLQGLLNTPGTMSRLDSWMTPLANGQGGYNADELSQIRMSPEEQENIVRSAGVSAGLRNSAGVNAAERASGGNPLALATYRARAAAQGASEGGDAMTNARVAASNAAAGRAQTIGNTRLGQQQTGLNYYTGLQNQGTGYLSGLQQQQAGAQQGALNRQAQTYGTATGAANSAGGLAQQASQNPTMFDKVMGGASAALSFLEDGDVMPAGKPAVIAENGPEKVVSTRRDYMDAGGVIPSLYRARPAAAPLDLGTTTPQADGSMMFAPGADNPGRPPSLYDNVPTPAAAAPRDLGTTTQNADGSIMFKAGPDNPGLVAQKPGGGFMDRFRSALQGSAPAQQQPPSSMNSAQTIGRGVGALAKAALPFLEDGAVMPAQGANGIFTKATRVNLMPGEAVVPLNYRANAKVRPSVAGLPAAPVSYRGGVHGRSSARP